MFNPEMMAAAQKMMANMKPEDMQRMSEFAANMDPKVMENMMKGMGGSVPPGMDMKQAAEQMKNMTPEQMKAGMNQAQNQMGAQKSYVYNGAVSIKNEGNTLLKEGKHKEALDLYVRALDNLKPHSADSEVRQLQVMLMTNSALCHLKRKEYQKAIDVCEDALKLNSKSVKAVYRRGLAKFELGQKSEGLADVKQAAEMSPEDKTIVSEMKRIEFECRESGMEDADIKKAEKAAKAAIEQADKAPASTPSEPQSFTPGGRSPDNMNEAMEQMAKNPEMMQQATEMMKNMKPEDMERMMKLRETMGAGGTPENVDMSAMSKALEDPEMVKRVAEMAKTYGDATGADPEEAAMMKQAAEQLAANPEMGKQMAEMMKNMPPEQMQKMMEMSAKMRQNKSGDASATSSSAATRNLNTTGPGGMDQESMDAMMSDPEMMKAAEEMMKSMSPETLAAMAKAQGIDIDEDKAKMMTKVMPFLPYALKAFRGFQKVKKGVKHVFSPTGRWIIAIVVILAALYQHYYGGR